MLTLEDILKHQNPGVRQDPYFYRIVSIRDIFDHRNDKEYINVFGNGILYKTIESIPKKYYNMQVHNIEPFMEKNNALSIKIVVI